MYTVGSRVSLILGCDRRFLILGTGLAVCLGFSNGFALWADAVMIALWLIMVKALRLLAKADQWMFEVVQRHFRYKKFYLAKSTPWCNGNGHIYH